MLLRVGCSLTYELAQPTPMIALLHVHHSRVDDLVAPDFVRTTPPTPLTAYHDSFGNWCDRLVAPAGRFQIGCDAFVRDGGNADEVPAEGAVQHAVEDLPADALMYLLPSRYCESDRLLELAWALFGEAPDGWGRVQAISRWVHEHVEFGYEWARPTKSAWEVMQERRGVCRDFAHLGVALCRAMNIPARYCSGYLADIGVPLPLGPMDFAGWSEVYLGGRWWVVDPRNLVPRVGRVLMARGRDAADVAITTTFGPNVLADFQVWTDEVDATTES